MQQLKTKMVHKKTFALEHEEICWSDFNSHEIHKKLIFPMIYFIIDRFCIKSNAMHVEGGLVSALQSELTAGGQCDYIHTVRCAPKKAFEYFNDGVMLQVLKGDENEETVEGDGDEIISDVD